MIVIMRLGDGRGPHSQIVIMMLNVHLGSRKVMATIRTAGVAGWRETLENLFVFFYLYLYLYLYIWRRQLSQEENIKRSKNQTCENLVRRSPSDDNWLSYKEQIRHSVFVI